MSQPSQSTRQAGTAGTGRLDRWSKRLDDSFGSRSELNPEPDRVGFSAPDGLGLGRRQRPLAERQDAAADGGEQGLRLELAGIADLRVVEARQPDLDRPFAFGLGFLGRLVELAGDALGVDLADQHVADRAWDARGGRGLHADLAEQHVDASLAVVAAHGLVAGGIAGKADAERG